MGSQLPDQVSNPPPFTLESEVLTTGPPGKSLKNLKEFNSDSHYCPLSLSPLLLTNSVFSWVLSK